VSYKQFDIVKVPFPFTDKNTTKKRPAVVLNQPNYQKLHQHCILGIITSAKNSSWPDDLQISQLEKAGLPSPSVIRFKLFTLDERFILGKLGTLSTKDKEAVLGKLKDYMLGD
jgi:mRNA interferase MazF